MTAEDPIQTDASTVHRPSRSEKDQSVRGAIDGSGMSADLIAEANTVIRGSSRAALSPSVSDPIDRTPASVAKVLLGQRLNHFLLEAMIGGGGMGAVFKAHDEQLDRTVAIKVIPFVGEDPDLQRRFRNESQSAAKLDHPRIAKVFDAGSHGRWHYIVFEYVEGTNIRDWVQTNGPLSIDEAVFYTVQLADALQHASDRGIVHRDIKPSNVLIASDGKIKLVDMGLARSDNLEMSGDMTASGVTLGTFDYISPEQAHDPRDADLRSDLYSLGCTLHFMLTGSPPYPGGTMLQKLLSHGNAAPPDTRSLRPEVSGNLVSVIQKMLAKKPGDRYQNANDLIADLHVVAARDGLTRSRLAGSIASETPNVLLGWLERHLPWLAAAALLVATAAWLQLESAASREDIIIPKSAGRPSRVLPVRPAPSASAPSNPSDGPSTAIAGTGAGTVTQSGIVSPQSTVLEPGLLDPSLPPGLAAETSAEAAALMIQRLSTGQPPRLTVFPVPNELTTSNPAMRPSGTTGTTGALAEPPPSVPLTASEQGTIIDDLQKAKSTAFSAPTLVRVVGPELDPAIDRDSSGAAIAPSLKRALEIAKKYQITHVEIAVPVLISGPVRIDVDDLEITSSVGGGSVIVFQSPEGVTMERARMFSIGSHPIEFNDLHFTWTVPSDQIDGGSMFEINDNLSVVLTDCSVTINNPSLRDEVYAFEIVTDPDKLPRIRREQGTARDIFPLVDMKLYNVIVRGEMTMMHMDYAAKLWLDWDNGMLAVTDRMIDTAGARRPPPPSAGNINLSLTRVTAHAPNGIMRTRLGVSGAYPVPTSRLARKCVFIVEPASAQFDIAGLSPDQLATQWLRMEGSSNAYIADNSLSGPMLRLSTTDGQTETTRMSQLSTNPPSWADENQPRWSVNWVAPRLTDKPMNRRQPADYRQAETSSAPGFSERQLPTLPVLEDNSSRLSSATFSAPSVDLHNTDDILNRDVDLTFDKSSDLMGGWPTLSR
ncbi:serine/threonine-protein kinase [Rubripirellula reticaptiva]|uniref:Serine/threonine-protein kinase PrkC n=1 Tax=Rubripirellula reticaptiva TaxID=2528013 RepID=A0A5C6F7Y0_9BACT|nr:serine/threonine-protein kinase [Rubripirellula reticaptiva]TWU57498.1 Serine/threonine-protein kinase PrkC [Rubripirellula reticaptiva]